MLANDSKNVFASQGVINPQAARWTGGFVELDYYPNELPFFETPGWFFAYQFGLIRNIQQGDPTFADDYNNVNSHAFVFDPARSSSLAGKLRIINSITVSTISTR